MEKIVYSKFSNERDPKFNIKTDILIDEHGDKKVRKSACQIEAKEHVNAIGKFYDILKEKYDGSKFEPNKCEVREDGVIFEFIKARTYEDLLDDCFAKKQENEIFGYINHYVDEVKKVYADKLFEKSEDFVKIFGDVTLPDKLSASTYINIDMIFQNIMITGDVWQAIDYEWTYPFLIPTNFLIYRALFYYAYQIEARQILNQKNIFLLYGLTQDEVETYEIMERNFQSYIRGNYAPISMLYQIIGKTRITTELIEKAHKDLEKNFIVQAYFDFGKDFTGENVVDFSVLPDEDGKVKFELDIAGYKSRNESEKDNTLIGIRIDPFVLPGLVQMNKLVGLDGRLWRSLKYETNGVKLSDDLTLFTHDDPQIIVRDGLEHIQVIQMEYLVEPIRGDISVRLSSELAKQEDLLNQQAQEIQQAQKEQNARDLAARNEAIFWNNEYMKMSKSLSWKLTKPLRASTDTVRKLLRKNPNFYRHYHYYKRILRAGKKQAASECIGNEINQDMEGLREFFQKNRDLEAEQRTTFYKNPKFSILVPLYNTPEKYLHQMIGTVLTQTYSNWELCLADGSDREHKYVGDICKWIAKFDSRIKYKRLEKNEGISENTNACLSLATGNYIGLYDHDDMLHTSALYEYARVIEEQNADFIYSDETTFHEKPEDAFMPHYKPDYAPDTLRTNNYICHFTVVKKELMDQVGGFRKEFDGSQDYDLVLRLTEKAKKIVHIREILYYWRAHAGSVASDVSAKPYTIVAAHKALSEHLQRVGLSGTILDTVIPSYYHIKYDIIGNPLISILIPNKDHVEDLKKCLTSIFEKSTYKNIEIVIIENNSEDEQTFAYYENLKQDSRIKVVTYEGGFNYAAINNFGFKHASGEYILLLNNDVEVIAPEWMEEMLMFVQRKDVGAAGAKLYYPDDTIQHAGLLLGVLTLAGHAHKNFDRSHPGYMGRLVIAQDLSGVTAACLLTKREVFEEINGFDERFAVAFNDVDLCMKIREKGYLIAFAPDAELYHYESKSRGLDSTPDKKDRFESEIHLFHEKWEKQLKAGDPYYNPHFSLDREDFTVIEGK